MLGRCCDDKVVSLLFHPEFGQRDEVVLGGGLDDLDARFEPVGRYILPRRPDVVVVDVYCCWSRACQSSDCPYLLLRISTAVVSRSPIMGICSSPPFLCTCESMRPASWNRQPTCPALGLLYPGRNRPGIHVPSCPAGPAPRGCNSTWSLSDLGLTTPMPPTYWEPSLVSFLPVGML